VRNPAFAPGVLIPTGFTCDAEDVSPPLRWSGVRGTVELALIVEDLDIGRRPFVHWVAWRIDPAAGGLPEGVVSAGVHEGRNSTGRDGYLGSCPPAGGAAHRYRFTLEALRRPLDLPLGATAATLLTAVRGAVLARAPLSAVTSGECRRVGLNAAARVRRGPGRRAGQGRPG
jgi:Raf kinase inhibitor-like YbhB/YbcL family protein